MDTIALQESVAQTLDLVIDEEAGTVKGVKILGAVSRNKLAFPEATRKAAHNLMESAHVNWDHRPKNATETALSSRFGWLTNVREDEANNCTRADLHYLKGHKEVPHFLSIVKQNPKLCGFSILGDATKGGTDGEGRTVVGAITAVKSFDLVADAANAMGLREAEDMAPPMDEPAPDAVAEPDENHADRGCMMAIMEIANGPGSDSEKLKKIKEHCAAHEELTGKKKEKEGEEEVADAEDEKENKADMKESVREIRKKNVLELCESLKYKPTESMVGILIHVPRPLREARVKKLALVQAPRSGPPSTPIRETVAAPAPVASTEDQLKAAALKAFKGKS